jgi:cytochrome b pre-mRNA-processing protein 3
MKSTTITVVLDHLLLPFTFSATAMWPKRANQMPQLCGQNEPIKCQYRYSPYNPLMMIALARHCRRHCNYDAAKRSVAHFGTALESSFNLRTQIPPPSPNTGIFSTNFDVTQPEHKERMDRWKWLLDLLGYFNEDAKLASKSALLFHSCVNQAAHPSFYRALDLVPDFRSQQALLMLHVWIVHRRLIGIKTDANGNSYSGKLLQEALFDRLWDETTFRIRHQNVSELTVNKHLHEVQQRCFSQCVGYDQYFAANSAKKRALSDALARNVLNVEPSTKTSQTSLLTSYVQRELKTLSKVCYIGQSVFEHS